MTDNPIAGTELPHQEQAGFRRDDQDPDVTALHREDLERHGEEDPPGRGDSDSDRTSGFVEDVGEHPSPEQIADYARHQRPQPS